MNRDPLSPDCEPGKAPGARQAPMPVLLPESLRRGVVEPDDGNFLVWLAGYLCEHTAGELALVGELWGADWDRVRSLVCLSWDGLRAPFTYDLQGTPCAEVLSRGSCCYQEDLVQRFPKDDMLRALGIESYLGLPLFDRTGLPLGLIVLMSRRRQSSAELREAQALLELFAPRTRSLLAGRRSLRELHLIIEGATTPSSKEAFQSLASALAHALHVRMALIGRPLDEGHETMRTLAIAADGQLLPNRDVTCAGTPCQVVYKQGLVFLRHGVQRTYSHGASSCGFPVEAYLGILLKSVQGRILGHVAVLHDRPLPESLPEASLLRVFVARISAELERLRAQEHRLAMEQKLLQVQKMESLGVLAGGVAHDFNNLLMTIVGNTSLVLERHDLSLSAREHLREVLGASWQASDLCRQMLAYSGQGKLACEAVNVTRLIQETAGLFKVSLSEGCQLAWDLDPKTALVEGDPVKLRQVVMNLVTNGIEALGDRGGTVLVRTKTVPYPAERDDYLGDAQPRGPHVLIQVQDDGCGMDEETRNRIFDPFFTTKLTGRGLGLAATRGIVHNHGGSILVESCPQEGTTFTVLLPVLANKVSKSGGRPPTEQDQAPS